MPAGLLLAPLLAGAAALGFGWFVVRLSGVYLAMLTLAFAQIVWAVVLQSAATGGDNGVLGVWPRCLGGDPRVFYCAGAGALRGGTLALRRVLFSPFGYALRAARDAPARAEAIGLWPARLRLAVFALAGAAAGLAGAVGAIPRAACFPPRSPSGTRWTRW